MTPPPVAAELSWPQVHAFRLARHHLTARAPKKQLVSVTGQIGGVQAQIMSAAELQVGVRVKCTVEDVRTALWKDRTLAKTWLVRSTLHLVPAVDLPLYTAAMRARWRFPNKAWLDYTQMTERELLKLIAAIGDALSATPLTRAELIAAVGRGRSQHIRDVLGSGWGSLLKPVARNGHLCFGPSRGQSVTFVRPEKWLGHWREVDPDEALVEVARRYLRAYGPATREDFARWLGAGLRPGLGKATWAGLENELVTVSIEGRRAQMVSADLRRMPDTPRASSVQLLPAFDPYLMGHVTREHLFDAVHRPRVSRTAGWISAVVLVDGRVAATWSHTIVKGTLRITVQPLERLSRATRPDIHARAEEIARALGVSDVEVVHAPRP
jgi:hypothetical protein